MDVIGVESTGSTGLSYWPIAVLGGLAMLVLAGLQYKRFTLGGTFSTSFMKGYGLILVATLGAVLVFASVSDGARTGAYTLLGTIAGYLAGTTRPSTTSDPDAPAGGAAPTKGGKDPEKGGDGVIAPAAPGPVRGIRDEPLG